MTGLPYESQRGIPPRLRREIAESLRGPSLGVMLYGSQARGSADMDSDVDVLQVVANGSGAYSNGGVMVTAYTPAHLHQMAAQGSLFILHLRADGVVISDPDRVLRRALDAYTPPASYDTLQVALVEASAALLVEGAEFEEYEQAIGRLGIYILRTDIYAKRAADGHPIFDVEVAVGETDEELLRILKLRRTSHLTREDVRSIQAKLADRFGVAPRGESLIDAAVRLAASNPHAASLIAQAITQGATMDYNAFPLPPL